MVGFFPTVCSRSLLGRAVREGCLNPCFHEVFSFFWCQEKSVKAMVSKTKGVKTGMKRV
jgi:hypothetical protein